MVDSSGLQPTILTTPTALGPIVRARRKAQLLRIDDTAALIGVSVDLMSRLENGHGSVRLDKALAVLDGLGLMLMVLPKEHLWVHEAATAKAALPSSVTSDPNFEARQT